MAQSADQQTDEEIAKKIQSGKIELFGVLVERYQEKMIRYARRFLFRDQDIEDLVQEIFLKAYTNLQSFDASRRFSPWLYRIAHNLFINQIKKKKREPLPFFNLDTFLPSLTAEENPETEMEKKEFCQMIDKCLAHLAIKYREPLILYYFEKLNYREISQALAVPKSTVGIRLKRAKEKLKEIYQKKYE